MQEEESAHSFIQLSTQVLGVSQPAERQSALKAESSIRESFLQEESGEHGTLTVALEKLHRVEMGIFQGSTRTWMCRGS